MAHRQQSALVVMPGGPQRDLVVRSLTTPKLRTIVADEPYEGYAQFVKDPADLIVLSLEGLTTSDHAFLRQVHRLAPAVRALVLVPEGRRQDSVAFLEAGADVVLPQTFLVAELQMIVRSLLRSEAGDPLTGLPNRPSFERGVLRDIARASRDGTTLALGLLDVDDFKKINTVLGFSRADEVLVEITTRARNAVRISDIIYRWGGEEFVPVLPGLPKGHKASHEQARVALERARIAVAEPPIEVPEPPEVSELLEPVTISGGFALFPHDVPRFKRPAGEYLSEEECERAGRRLFDVANHCLAYAKFSGKNKIIGVLDLPPDWQLGPG